MIYILIPTTPDRHERVRETIASIQEHTKGIDYSIVIYENDYIGWPKAVQAMIQGIDGMVILLESDVVVKEHWLEILLNAWYNNLYQDKPPSKELVLEPLNDLHNGNLIQHPMCHSSVLRRLISTKYFHAYADNELNDRIKEECHFVYVPESKIEHRHFLVGKAEKDLGYEVANDSVRVNEDREIYQKRKANGWK